jgi:zinc protease
MFKNNFLKAAVFFIIVVFLFPALLTAQLKTTSSEGYEYQYVDNDPLNARIYKLNNGLMVYMSVNKSEPRIQTYIAVKAGSKNDPADATGLAHYFEHIMFKGTKNFGTKDYLGEKPFLDNITELFEVYRKTSDSTERRKIYRQIDSISLIASRFAIANEYDKIVGELGAKWTNAFTDNEETVYMNDIPSNMIEKWLNLEFDRFKNPVFRLFHTELEVVYDEKNRYEDYGWAKAFDVLYSLLFKKHQYGTQTTLGTTEHLKSPTIKKLYDYFGSYYVPNNFAICLAGDFNPDETIKMIDKTFGTLIPGNVPLFTPAVEEPIESPQVKEISTPDEEMLFVGYRFNGVNSDDENMITVINEILCNNNKAGIIDLNLVKEQKVLEVGCWANIMRDYSVHTFYAKPKQGQKLEEIKDLILSQIDLLKEGKFADWYLEAVINTHKYNQLKSFENNYSRAFSFVNSFTSGTPWDKFINKSDIYSKITKEQIVEFVKKNYNNNYAVVYKRTGPGEEEKKIIKPEITPVNLNREEQSDFYNKMKETKISDIQPIFLDFNIDLTKSNMKNDVPFLYKENIENKTFDLIYHFDMGKNNVRKINLAIQYLQYLGSSKHTAKEFEQELYKLGCNFDVRPQYKEITIYLSGFTDNFEKALQLIEEKISDPVADESALKNLVSDIRKARQNDKLNKDIVLWDGLYNYGIYGTDNPFKNRIKDEELDYIKAKELTEIIKNIFSYQHKILYYGSDKLETVMDILNKNHKSAEKLQPPPIDLKFVAKPVEENNVYFVNFDLKEVEIIMVSRGEKYNKDLLPDIKMFNEYFGGKMSSIVFTELRESKGLTYGAWGSYDTPDRKDGYCSIMMYLGTQPDKMSDALKGMNKLLENDLPKSDALFSSAKTGILKNIQTERFNRINIILEYINSLRLGVDYDLRKDIYEKVPSLNFDEVQKFHKKYILGKKYNILIIGDKKKIDFKVLKQFGEVEELSLKEVFGF